jgi:hypothetical protein
MFSGLFEGADEVNKYSQEYQFGQKYGWYHSIHKLAGGDVRYFDEVTRLKAAEAFTFLMYEKDKDRVQTSKLKKSINR